MAYKEYRLHGRLSAVIVNLNAARWHGVVCADFIESYGLECLDLVSLKNGKVYDSIPDFDMMRFEQKHVEFCEKVDFKHYLITGNQRPPKSDLS